MLVTSAQGLVSPTTLVVDFSTQKLYWLDRTAEKIGHVNFDGSELETMTRPIFRLTTSFTILQVSRPMKKVSKYWITYLYVLIQKAIILMYTALM